MANSIERLTEMFSHFPGIGPRQARRFVYYLLHQNETTIAQFTDLVRTLHREVSACASCRRFAILSGGSLCAICANPNRDRTLLMIIAKDIDLENIEKTHSYEGEYFVLGATVPLTDHSAEKLVRAGELKRGITLKAGNLKEIIIAMAASTEGDHTTELLRDLLAPIASKHAITISTLGRGLSTGTELEYSDASTIENALRNRKGVT